MSEYIITCDEETALWIGNDVDSMRSLVRCRDCEHYEYREHLGRSYCCGEYATEPDGFCAWAVKRKEGGDD